MSLHFPVEVFCDNTSATYLVVNPINQTRTKHLEVDLHFVQEHVLWSDIVVLHISGYRQIAYIFTKGLSFSHFKLLSDNLGVVSHTQIEEGNRVYINVFYIIGYNCNCVLFIHNINTTTPIYLGGEEPFLFIVMSKEKENCKY